MSDFWRRWHISLSSWLQTYLYFPLGGSRKGKTRTYLNLLIVMTISGLWHGAGWTFVLWGFLHGILSCFERKFRKSSVHIPKWVIRAITYVLVSFLWIFFRADSPQVAFNVIAGMLTIHTGIFQPYTWTGFAVVFLIAYTVMAARRAKKNGDININGFYPILNLGKVWQLSLFMFICGLVILMGYYGDTAFIYGAF